MAMFEIVSQRVSTVYTMVEARDMVDARAKWEANGVPLDASEFVDAETIKRITPYDDPFEDEEDLTQFEEYTDDDYLESSN